MRPQQKTRSREALGALLAVLLAIILLGRPAMAGVIPETTYAGPSPEGALRAADTTNRRPWRVIHDGCPERDPWTVLGRWIPTPTFPPPPPLEVF